MEAELGKKLVKEKQSSKWRRLILFILCGAFFIWSFQQIMNEHAIGFDESIRSMVNGWEAEALISFFHLFTMLGDKTGVIIIMLLSIMLIWWKQRDYAAMGVIVGGVIIVNELNKWLKGFTGRERPMTGPGAESLSFPSGHAMVGLFFYGLLLYFALAYTKQSGMRFFIAIFGVIFIALLGTSRVFLNYHYPSDVFAGYAAGYICLILGVLLYEWIQSLRQRKKAM
ncbi:phosphatase PAP2 family protein [Sutcliffiella horikoshii]|uniref:phosphatase PAP2 family protein n=1 Tax=Sutcliffiella horikoshii TaxID=79883 RepID=UPI001CBACBB7|nr:phosphatase PAP2 family protein [Sutcliffiella horikoshii]UAL48538.1 phosphatase PAP2 family protein [Sutcliffiella horikoshii]